MKKIPLLCLLSFLPVLTVGTPRPKSPGALVRGWYKSFFTDTVTPDNRQVAALLYPYRLGRTDCEILATILGLDTFFNYVAQQGGTGEPREKYISFLYQKIKERKPSAEEMKQALHSLTLPNRYGRDGDAFGEARPQFALSLLGGRNAECKHFSSGYPPKEGATSPHNPSTEGH